MVLRNPLRPFGSFPYPSSQWFSPLDFKAEASGVRLVEQAFIECPALSRLARALSRLIDSSELGQLALKKALLSAFEGRLRALALRADPPESHGFGAIPLPASGHPLDSWLASGLGLSVRPAGLVDMMWHRIELLTLAIAVIVRAAWIGLRFGRLRVTPRVCRLLALNAWPESFWIAVAETLSEHAGYKPGDLLTEVNPLAKDTFATIPSFRPDALPVAIGPWLARAVLGSIKLAAAALFTGLRSANDPRVVEGAIQTLRLANQTLDARRLTGAVHFEICVDNMEYDPRHILIGALAPTARMVRLPRTEMDTPGVGLSYLGYDLFPSSGTYQFDSFGHTWKKGARAMAVGPIQNDRRLRSPVHVASEYSAAIEAELSRGRQMIVLFGPSNIAGIWPLFLRQLDAVLDAVSHRDDWFIVVKPKGTDYFCAEVKKIPDLDRKLRSQRVICLRYPIPGQEVCSIGYLMGKMTLGVSLGGSVMTEALCHNRVFMVFYPVSGETPLRRKLRDLGLLHITEGAFRAALDAFMADRHEKKLPFDWFRERFDPFGDDRALDRFAAALCLRSGQAEAPPAIHAAL